MVNEIVVRIDAERILNKGLDTKTGQVYLLDDITNPDYRQKKLKELTSVPKWCAFIIPSGAAGI